jgi:hypothetical protein
MVRTLGSCLWTLLQAMRPFISSLKTDVLHKEEWDQDPAATKRDEASKKLIMITHGVSL